MPVVMVATSADTALLEPGGAGLQGGLHADPASRSSSGSLSAAQAPDAAAALPVDEQYAPAEDSSSSAIAALDCLRQQSGPERSRDSPRRERAARGGKPPLAPRLPPAQRRRSPRRASLRQRRAAAGGSPSAVQQGVGRGTAREAPAAAHGAGGPGGVEAGFVLVAKALTKSDMNGRVILPRVMVETNLSFLMGYRSARQHFSLAPLTLPSP